MQALRRCWTYTKRQKQVGPGKFRITKAASSFIANALNGAYQVIELFWVLAESQQTMDGAGRNELTSVFNVATFAIRRFASRGTLESMSKKRKDLNLPIR
jgi:hypothetical protein